ncbi:MAG: chloride channel protein [Firmicutes bacterium]|nr:chloride channel protein [Bacillota bacterium]
MPAPRLVLLPTRQRRLHLLAHTRRMAVVILPLGAGMGLLVAMALRALWAFEPWVNHAGKTLHVSLLLPAFGLFLATAFLHFTGIGEVSLLKDLALAKQNPTQVFPFWVSLGKVVACGLTIGFGGSLGVEGPGKWFGAAVGLQAHRALTFLSGLWAPLRRLKVPPLVMIRAGAGAALAAVFRAPLSGALMAAESHGRVDSVSLVPCLVAAASGYVTFASTNGLKPLLPMPGLPPLGGWEIASALGLGLLAGLVANLFQWALSTVHRHLRRVPLLWRGLAAGLGLVLLALPAHVFWPGLPVTQGGGLEFITRLLADPAPAPWALAFLALKLLATALTLAGGGVGGLWLPSLAMGASLGAAFAGAFGLAHPGYLLVVGAAAFTGATHHTLLVPVVFLAETTAQASLVVPALVATTLSFLVSRTRD